MRRPVLDRSERPVTEKTAPPPPDDPERFRKVEHFPVQRKVHSLAIDLRTHRLYAPEEQEEGQPVARMAIFDAVSPTGTSRR